MVSPCKKRKVDRKGKETAENSSTRNLSGQKKGNKLLKPLSDKKFYLDIKNHVSLKRIEEKLKSLGASLELFLVKDVDYVVTDRADYPRPSPSPYCSVSPATTDSPTDGVASKRTRSRAEAMLDRLKHQPQKASGDVLDNAISWRIPIYTLQRFLEWVGRVGRRGGLKLEVPRSRPDLRLFTTWPRPPFSTPQTRMTRKGGRPAKDSSSSASGGYCEVCRVNYNDVDEHITSSGHLKLVTDPTQYSHLDSIIEQHSLGVGSRKSLRIAKSPPMGGKQSSPPPPHRAPPTLNGHVTRSSKPPPQQQAECNGTGSPPEGHNLRSTPGRRGRVSRKRLSAEEKLIEDNKAYYKVEVLNSKLRSTGYMISQKAVEEARGEPEPPAEARLNGENPEKEAPVVVRFKKVRRSQLAVLSDEAESFMFGERRSSSSDNEEEETREENKKKRRTHAEAFIHDNLDYYKFEISGSRLRSAGGTDGEEGKEFDIKLSDVEFGFERCERKEPWIDTYRRLDCGEERYIKLHHDYPSVDLPNFQPPPRKLTAGPSSLAGSTKKHKTVASIVSSEDKPRKSPRRCHASTLAILSSLTRRGRGGREPVFYTEEESLPETVISSSSACLSESGGGATTPPTTGDAEFGATTPPRMGTIVLPLTGVDRVAECLREGKTSWSQGPCLDIDPQILHAKDDIVSLAGMESGPTLDMEELIRGSPEPCGLGPAAMFLFHSGTIAELGSCDGSDCSDVLGFLDDGRVVVSGRRKRKRKKRNLTGWPLEKIKKKPQKAPKPSTPQHLLTSSAIFSSPLPTLTLIPEVSLTKLALDEELLLSTASDSHRHHQSIVIKRRVGRPSKKHKASSGGLVEELN